MRYEWKDIDGKTSMRTPALTVDAVSKKYRLQRNQPLTLHELFVKGLAGRLKPAKTFWALKDVTFSLLPGRSLGIIGHNGAGKSTLLRLLCGLGRPTKGRIKRFGHISGLLDLGKGFHPDMTGRENLFTGGILNGLSKHQVTALEKEIIAFSELEEFIDQPVRTYSKGMYLRLAFATVIHMDPDILVIDEVLSVGDQRFGKKCTDWLDRFRAAGKTMILTSHDMDQIRHLSDEVLILEEGRIDLKGDPARAIKRYNDLMWQRTEKRAARLGTDEGRSPTQSINEGMRSGTREATLSDVRLFNEHGELNGTVDGGSGLTVEFAYDFGEQITDAAFVLGIYSETDIKCFETYLVSFTEAVDTSAPRGFVRCRFPEMPLNPGKYYVNLGFRPPGQSYVYDYYWKITASPLGIPVKKGVGTPEWFPLIRAFPC